MELLNIKINIRVLSLLLLSIQTTVFVLLLRYSRLNQEESYLISTAVLLSEVIKIVFSFILLLLEKGGLNEAIYNGTVNDLFDVEEAVKLLIPAVLYVVQNNLLYLALSYLDAATYQITYQLKILTTAFFSWFILGKYLRPVQWISLIFLMTGVILVQIEDLSNLIKNKSNVKYGESANSSEHSSHGFNDNTSWLIGVTCVLFSCISSGFAGVYFEKLVKHGKTSSLGIRNLHLGFFSIIFCLISILPQWKTISTNGFFYGYCTTVWIVILLQSAGGLIVSITMKYADNILKGFATSVSIITSTIASWLILRDRPPSLQFVAGASIVILATLCYGILDRQDDRRSLPYKRVPTEEQVY